MSLFSEQQAFCRACGREVRRTASWLHSKHGACSRSCLQEIEWRYTLSIMGKEHYPDPRALEGDDSEIK